MDHGKIKEEIKKFLELNENENELIQTLWDAVKVVIREKFITSQQFYI